MNSNFVFYAMTWWTKLFDKALERKFERYYSLFFSIEAHVGGICMHDISMNVHLLFKNLWKVK
jgi:hypothetical protein